MLEISAVYFRQPRLQLHQNQATKKEKELHPMSEKGSKGKIYESIRSVGLLRTNGFYAHRIQFGNACSTR
jgi:hypothetical protein